MIVWRVPERKYFVKNLSVATYIFICNCYCLFQLYFTSHVKETFHINAITYWNDLIIPNMMLQGDC
jgi:hypothetical protein